MAKTRNRSKFSTGSASQHSRLTLVPLRKWLRGNQMTGACGWRRSSRCCRRRRGGGERGAPMSQSAYSRVRGASTAGRRRSAG